jgi:NhaD family Na+/H+ antiporter
MEQIIILIFILGYLAIAFEHPLKINKTGAALFMGLLLWTVYRIGFPDHLVAEELAHHIEAISEILFFLMGAMTIVELIDAHNGFNAITNRIKTRSKIKLLWIIAGLSFFLSSVLDNLTTSIVMVSLIRKLLDDREQRLFFAGMIVIAANAGGAWSPIGDVTTTMLWIGGQISAPNIVESLFIPSLVCLLVPLIYVSVFKKNKFAGQLVPIPKNQLGKENMLIFVLGIGGLLFVPIYKQLTHLPPYTGILLAIGLLWLVAELIHRKKDADARSRYSASAALMKIDMPSILFFMGILLAVGVLESLHILEALSASMNQAIGNQNTIVFCIGILSAIVDNVPLVAATMAMYDLNTFPQDSTLWEFIAYCAGTGGSLLIIGSAAGVAAMGIEKIDFIWYFKKISFIALLGYVAGAMVYLLM